MAKPKVLGVSQVLKQISHLDQSIQDEAKAVLKGSLQQIKKQARSDVPVKSGRLKKTGSLRMAKNEFSGTVKFGGKGARQANLIEGGTKAHAVAIPGKYRKKPPSRVLTNTKAFFGKAVRHPGTPAQPFLGPAFDTEAPKFEKQLTRVISKEFRK